MQQHEDHLRAAAAAQWDKPSPQAAAAGAGAGPDLHEAAPEQQSSQRLDKNILGEIFRWLPHNILVLTVKSLSTNWHQWVVQKLGNPRAKRLLVKDHYPTRYEGLVPIQVWGSSCMPFRALEQSDMPLWALKQPRRMQRVGGGVLSGA